MHRARAGLLRSTSAKDAVSHSRPLPRSTPSRLQEHNPPTTAPAAPETASKMLEVNGRSRRSPRTYCPGPLRVDAGRTPCPGLTCILGCCATAVAWIPSGGDQCATGTAAAWIPSGGYQCANIIIQHAQKDDAVKYKTDCEQAVVSRYIQRHRNKKHVSQLGEAGLRPVAHSLHA